ncbi:MAG: DEAD/DEAH box helicase family protein, partial [Oligoflexia bacterium]|nr:DEAD/DEAH box helicase family protein [Oligoflexia bacterium]
MLAHTTVQDKDKVDWSKSLGVAIREYPTEKGKPADYALFVDRNPVGIIEAKRDDTGHKITTVEEQSAEYADNPLKSLDNKPLSFRYEATGILTRYTDSRDPKPRSREVFQFHKPETLWERLTEENTLRGRLKNNLPLFSPSVNHFRDCQIRAITNLESSFRENRPRALIQMATGSGKTFTAITAIYRLLKFAKAKKILFLVDTKNLGEQAEQEFSNYTPTDDNRRFTELYGVTRLKSKYIPKDSSVYISTIQRLYSILKFEDLDDSLEETNPNEPNFNIKPPSEVAYNPEVPIEFFDFIIIDECHRSIYNLWKQVFDYFDAFLIGLTATPDKRTFGFFNESVVSEYSHVEAIADGVNVGFDTYIIETKISKTGDTITAKEYVDKRNRLTRKTRWEQLDEDVAYHPKELDRKVVNPSQIRNIIKTFKNKWPEIFPHREEVPKTLIFAKTDSHADDIINIVREEFGEDNNFCKKITYQSTEDPKSLLSQFRNDYNPRIAVTVDMIATGTDVKPLECLIFMRDVRSKSYFEQMLGRGTRTYDKDDLQKVSPSTQTKKTHFVVIDAVGVSNSNKTEMKPLERKKHISTKELLNAVLMGNKEEDVYSSLAGRLSRFEKNMTDSEKEEFKKLSSGREVKGYVKALLDSHDPDLIEDKAREKFNVEKEPTEEQKKEIQTALLRETQSLFSGALNTFIIKTQQQHEQIIDKTNLDRLDYAGWSKEQRNSYLALIQDFEDFIEKNKDEITALSLFYNEPHRRKEITYNMIDEIYQKLKTEKPNLSPLRVYSAYAMAEEKPLQ